MINNNQEYLNRMCFVDDKGNPLSKMKMAGWISVKDQLPENHYQRILIYSYVGNMHVVNYFKNSGNSGTLWTCDAGFEGENILFTHWMPLPKVPKIEESNEK